MSPLTRREFLVKLGAAGVATAATSWYSNRLFAMATQGLLPDARGPGLQTWTPTLCRMCPAGCGIRVRLVDGLPVGLAGNRINPLSAGGLCPAGLAGLHELVHPDRLRTPLRRDGPRGSGRWTAISWEQAMDLVAGPLLRLRVEGRPQGFAVLERGDSPLTRFWIQRVLRAFGSPNLIVEGVDGPWRSAWAYAAGAAEPPAPDLPNSDFILSFGHELFETDGHPVWQAKIWGQLRAPAGSPQASLAYAGPRLSPTAIRADLRVPIRPDTEGVLALGLVHVLLTENLVNRPFLARWTRGYLAEGPRGEGFESYIRTHYHPEEVSRLTGAPVSEIFRLGRAFGASRRPVALVGADALAGEHGLATAMSVVALNAVVGAIGRSGGYVRGGGAPLDLPATMEPDDTGRQVHSAQRVDGAGWAWLPVVAQSPAGLVANLSARKPYPVDVLLVHGVNPMHEWPDARAVEQALAAVSLVVVIAPQADETARIADLLLPESSFLESWQILPSPPGVPIEYAGLQQPVVPPLYKSRAFEDAWFALARRLGGAAAASVPAGSYGEWLPRAAGGLFRAGRGATAGDEVQERVAGFMQSRGWKAPGPPTEAAFWEQLRLAGSWGNVGPVQHSPEEVLSPGSQHLSFWPEALLRDAAALTGTRPGPDFPYPDAAAQNGVAAKNGTADLEQTYPLRLLLFDTGSLRCGRAVSAPLMLELSGFREDIGWDSWIEIHPDTARRAGIRAGDRVGVRSASGWLQTRAVITPAVPPDAVAMPRGLGHRHFGRFATGVGANPMTLVSRACDRWTGAAVVVTRVRLSAQSPA